MTAVMTAVMMAVMTANASAALAVKGLSSVWPPPQA